MAQRGAPASSAEREQALLGERVEAVEDLATQLRRGTADLLGVDQDRAAGHDREAREESAVGIVEEVVAPLDGAPQGALPLGEVARAAREQPESVAQPVPEGLHGQDAQSRGGQLDGEAAGRPAWRRSPPPPLHWRPSSVKSARAAMARSTKRRTASEAATSEAAPDPTGGRDSVGTWNSCSP